MSTINSTLPTNGDSPPAPAPGKILSRQTQLEQMRPTLIIGSGGTGQLILTFLKAILEKRFGPLWRQRIRLLAFDTAEEPFAVPGPDGLVSLEPTAEFIHIGNVPVAAIKRNLQSQEAIQARLGAVMNSLAPVVLRSGAKQLRALGLLAMLWNYTPVSEQISQALWALAGRGQTDAAHLSQQQGINVFICGSLVGGTGSGTMLDLAHLVRAYFTELGAQAEFCHITGIGVLHQAFRGISGPNMIANCGAFLQELNHLMLKDSFRSVYPDGRLIQAQGAPFNIFHAIDGVDARGQTWNDIYEVTAMAAESMFLQMGTQMGRKGENAFDNLDDVLAGQTPDGQGQFLGSFGKGDLVFNAPGVADLHTAWFLLDLLRQNWLQPAQPAMVAQQSTALLAGLSAGQAREYLLRDPETGQERLVELALPTWLLRKPADEVALEASQYVREYDLARIKDDLLPEIGRQADRLAQSVCRQWADWLTSRLFQPETNPATLAAVLQQVQETLTGLAQQAQKQTVAEESALLRLAETMSQWETAVSRAASGFPLGRANRIQAALTHYFQAAEAYNEAQVSHQLARSQRAVWHELEQWVGRQQQAVVAFRERLVGIAAQLEVETPLRLRKLAAAGIATISLATPEFVTGLYHRHKPGWTDVPQRLTSHLDWLTWDRETLLAELLNRLSVYFEPVTRIGIEQAIGEQTAEMSARARREQIFRLATPSWNLDRARMPDGGAGLARLEVLGVPDVGDTLFEGEPMLVSTHDPYRLTALVVVAGAPPSALQQYNLYQEALERLRHKRPLYVLPDFLTTSDQGRLMFALGSIFGLIYSQGTFFYYQPADPLSNPVKLANGLSNAINAFIEREELVGEVIERVNAQIARLGLREAIAILTGYYSNSTGNNTSLDEPLRELKRLVRDYAESLRSIDAFSAGIKIRS